MDDQEPKLRRTTSFSVIPNEALYYVDDPRDCETISLVCRQWHRVDSAVRKHVTNAFCYSAAPAMLRSRFARLESLKLKGKPRLAMFNLILEDWDGYAGLWIAELANGFDCLKELHLRRMVVTDEDIEILVGARGHAIQSLKLPFGIEHEIVSENDLEHLIQLLIGKIGDGAWQECMNSCMLFLFCLFLEFIVRIMHVWLICMV